MSQVWESKIIVDAALTWHDAGCSIIPICADGTKKPLIKWQQFIEHRADTGLVSNWFTQNPRLGIGIICGRVSGGLEMLELEGRACNGEILDRIVEACGEDTTFLDLLTDGYCEWTPSGGLHFLYRLADHDVPGNTKVARRPASDDEIAADMAATGLPIEKINKIKCLAETRGEGGYLVVAPSQGRVHATGDAWSVAAGQLGVIPTITWRQRQMLVHAIHDVLDEMPEPVTPAPRPAPTTLIGSSLRPGDDYNQRVNWQEILGSRGWTVDKVQGGTIYWVRPGKDRRLGHSATTGHSADGDRLYVFSSSTEFEPETPYTKFAAYTLLEHGGDYAAAARTLRSLGYGAPATSSMAVPVAAGDGLAVEGWEAAAVQPATTPPVQAAQIAVRDPNWLHAWAKPFIPADALEFDEQSYAAASSVYAGIYEDTFKYCGEMKKWFFFNGCTWEHDRKDGHEQGAIHMLMETGKRARADNNTELAKWIRSMGRSSSPNLARWARSDPRIAIVREQFDQRRHLITLENGIFDLDTATFTNGHDPKLLLTKKLGIHYDKDAAAPRWDSFLAQVLPNADMRSYVQRAAGLTLLGDAEERALFLLHGKSGTGKSQFIRVMELLFGDFAETAAATTFNSASKTTTLTNDLNDLRGKRFVSLSELDQDEKLNESLVKRITGGDTAKSRGMYQENRQWRVEFMMWMATNYLPRLNSDDNAIWRRVKPIEFPTEVATLGPEVRGLAESIFAEESSGILNWLLEGARMYQADGLDDLEQITEAVATYRRDVDTAAQFVDAAAEDDTITVGPEQQMPARNLHAIYQGWCQRNGIRPLGERRFGQRMESLGFQRKRAAGGIMWLGVGTGQHGLLGTMPMRQ